MTGRTGRILFCDAYRVVWGDFSHRRSLLCILVLNPGAGNGLRRRAKNVDWHCYLFTGLLTCKLNHSPAQSWTGLSLKSPWIPESKTLCGLSWPSFAAGKVAGSESKYEWSCSWPGLWSLSTGHMHLCGTPWALKGDLVCLQPMATWWGSGHMKGWVGSLSWNCCSTQLV